MRRAIKLFVTGLFFQAMVSVVAVLYPNPLATARGTDQASADFKRDIEPIFAASCYQCHGPKKAAGQLRLDVKASAMKGGISGAVILPGNSNASILLKRILGEGDEARMPMGGEALKADQIELIRKWIDQGAPWPDANPSQISNLKSEIPKHWAYLKPARPALPKISNPAWVRNPIDAFVLARLDKEGLKPSPEASKETLLRRVYLDLIGLPPSVKEIDEFLADKSPDAYEKVVDRLLSNPHYGERWARPWLDLARYADSNGYEKDNLRVMWKYRDWVINALNADMPFDQFTIEQIAGDMLPDATIDQKIATGFHRNTQLNTEGGVDPDAARYEVMVDRVNTTATVWLGTTLACAQCHNHKYDPFTQRDYYKLYAFFDNSAYQIRGTAAFDSVAYEPTLELPTPEQESKRKDLNDQIAKLETTLKTQTPELDAAQAEWEKEILAEPSKWTTLDPSEFKSTGGSTLTKLEDRSLLASGKDPEFDEYIIKARLPLNKLSALRIEAMPDKSLPRGGPGRDLYGNFILSTIEVSADGQLLRFNDGGWDDGLSKIDTKAFFNYEMNAVSDRPRGWLINAMNDQTRMMRQAVFALDKPFTSSKPVELTIRLKFLAGGLCQDIGRVRLSVTDSDSPLKLIGVPASLKLVMAKPVGDRTEKEKRDLSAQFRNTTPMLKAERDQLKELQDSVKSLGIVTALVLQEKSGFDRPSTWVRERGGFYNHGEKVYAGTPAALPPMPDSAPTNRLGLAKWLVDENNPLTARVTVNRFWEEFFGRGIVETAEDFGSQGSPPSHPELLDWLATEFMNPSSQFTVHSSQSAPEKVANNEPRAANWSQKMIQRLIVTSATYRQDSGVSAELQERDQYNRLLARGPRFRVEAEMIRDLSLAASGLLSQKIGGPSVMPPQPEGVWRNPYSSEKWSVSKGEDRYRRGLYTFLRRTSPYPAMMTFDATSREQCTVRRIRTNTPLQSLTLLNDDAAMEMARALAKRMFLEIEGDTKARLDYGFRLCTGRHANAAELDRLTALYDQQLANYKTSPQTADKLLKGENRELPAPELAAWTLVANVLLNLDETLTKQ
ncbi:MAG: PSD1 domain-containing protein [Acidobacteria bacterium]|nr:PSD1 domain-containing protein [Acidobacteriota bacterium]